MTDLTKWQQFSLGTGVLQGAKRAGDAARSAAEMAASNEEQLAEMRKQGAAAAKADAERNRILQQQADVAKKEDQKRTKLLEDQTKPAVTRSYTQEELEKSVRDNSGQMKRRE